MCVCVDFCSKLPFLQIFPDNKYDSITKNDLNRERRECCMHIHN